MSKRIQPWSIGHSDSAICLSCNIKINRKPSIICVEKKHFEYFENKKKRNNIYRKGRRKENPYYACGYTKQEWTEYSRIKYRLIKRTIINNLGNQCSECGFKDFRALQIDHILYGIGNSERKEKGWSYLNELYKMSVENLNKKFQCLCANCHSIKSYNEKYKPLQTNKIAKKENQGI